MRKRFLLNLIGIFLITCSLWGKTATGDSINYLRATDTVYLQINYYGEKIFEHRLARKQTLYSLASFYGMSLTELYYYNPELRNQEAPLHYPVRVPIPNRSIIRYLPDDYLLYNYVPVCYVVKRGDTMYRISKYFFRMDPAEIRLRNGLPDDNLKVGQLLHIGWMSIDGVPEDYRLTQGGPQAQRSNQLRKQFTNMPKMPMSRRGVAVWDKNNKEETDLYALHRTAPVNSVIEVNNPLTRRTAYVKVIGKLPERVHGKEVVIVLSPSAAHFLGAIDGRFFVRIQHY
jgi:hypothetical protein